ncbi:flagellar biosynthesis anti-sigma factor FlgM [bacterium J17]|nr:flagellar biosynthesis anti-sigma factor FlgM [bacterium J17]
MKISDIFKSRNVDQSAQSLKSRENAPRPEEQVEQASRSGQDSVSISPLARQLAQVKRIVAEDDLARSDRVAELREQVQAGTYEVSSLDVAKSVVSFARDSEFEGA